MKRLIKNQLITIAYENFIIAFQYNSLAEIFKHSAGQIYQLLNQDFFSSLQLIISIIKLNSSQFSSHRNVQRYVAEKKRKNDMNRGRMLSTLHHLFSFLHIEDAWLSSFTVKHTIEWRKFFKLIIFWSWYVAFWMPEIYWMLLWWVGNVLLWQENVLHHQQTNSFIWVHVLDVKILW